MSGPRGGAARVTLSLGADRETSVARASEAGTSDGTPVLTAAVAADDPSGCTRFAVTVAPAVIAPRAVARSVGDVVAGCVGDHRHDDVVLAVHDVLIDATRRDPHDPVTIRVREHDDRVEVEIVDRDPSVTAGGAAGLRVARLLCEDLVDELTADGHLVRLTYRCRPD